MKITIVGAGNMGLAMTAYMAKKQCSVTLFTSRSVEVLSLLDVEQEKLSKVSGYTITDSPEKAFGDVDVIFCTYPAFLRKRFLEQNARHIKKGAALGFVPGYGGIEYQCKSLIESGITIFALQRVPYVARAKSDGTVYQAEILSKKSRLFTGAIPALYTKRISEMIEDLLDIPCTPLHEYLSITLAPSNPLLHITGLYTTFKDWKLGMAFDHPLRFYTEWNDETSQILFRYDAELQTICSRLTGFAMDEVVPLSIYYESDTPEKMTAKLKSIKAFEAVMVPLKQSEQGYVPDFESRMFVEDFPYGVCIIKDFALMTGTETPIVDMMLEFYRKLTGYTYFNPDGSYAKDIQTTGIPGLNGIHDLKALDTFYHQ